MRSRKFNCLCAGLALCMTLSVACPISAKADSEMSDDIYAATADTPDKDTDLQSSSAVSGTRLSVTAKKGDTVNVICHIDNAKKVLGLQERITYDTSALEYTSKVFSVNYDSEVSIKSGEVAFNEIFSAKGTDFGENAVIVTFSFTALKDISAGDEVAAYKIEEFFDKDYGEFSTEKVPVTVSTVSGDTTSYVFGDVDGDGEVTAADSLGILRQSVGLESFEGRTLKLADVDNDGEVTAVDALITLRYSVGLTDDNVRVGELLTV